MLDFVTDNELITETELSELELLIDADLPEDYKKHMLKYNGGFAPASKNYVINDEDETTLSYFHPIRYGHETVEKYYSHKHDDLYPTLLPVGATGGGGYLAMAVQGESYGAIYIYYSDTDPKKIADSFAEFIEGIEVYDADIE